MWCGAVGEGGAEGMKGGVCLFVRDGRQHPDLQRGEIEGRAQADRGRRPTEAVSLSPPPWDLKDRSRDMADTLGRWSIQVKHCCRPGRRCPALVSLHSARSTGHSRDDDTDRRR